MIKTESVTRPEKDTTGCFESRFNKLHLLLAAFVVLLVIAGCSKDSDNDPQGNNPPPVQERWPEYAGNYRSPAITNYNDEFWLKGTMDKDGNFTGKFGLYYRFQCAWWSDGICLRWEYWQLPGGVNTTVTFNFTTMRGTIKLDPVERDFTIEKQSSGKLKLNLTSPISGEDFGVEGITVNEGYIFKD